MGFCVGNPRILSVLFLVLPVLAAAQRVPIVYIETLSAGQRAFVANDHRGSVLFAAGGFQFRESGARLAFLGVGARAGPSGVGSPQAHINLISSSSASSLPAYDAISYPNLYPGIELRLGSENSHLKSEFVVQPRASPSRIQWVYNGVRGVTVSRDGSLQVRTSAGTIRESRPVAFQIIQGRRAPVPVRFRILRHRIVTFEPGAYDTRFPLVIDPVLTFQMSTGGTGTDTATAVSRDASGNIYVAGWTDSPVFSSAVAGLPRSSGVDGFVMKLDGSTKALLYLTYVAGSGDDRILGLAVDPDGYAYICGSTTSTDFPTSGAQKSAFSGNRDAFVGRLDQAGKSMLFSLYLGGSGADSANGIALDSSGNAYVVGETDSVNFPVVSAMQAVNRGGLDVFVAEVRRNGGVSFATYLGGTLDDRGLGIALDASANVYLTGVTASLNFPTKNPLQSARHGGQDAFVAKLNAGGASLAYSTYLGGSGGTAEQPETGYAIAVDVAGNAYVAGTTPSSDFPAFSAYQSAWHGWDSDAFVTKLNPTGTQLLYSTFLGGADFDAATAIVVDTMGDALVAGYTASPDFPAVQPVQAQIGGMYDAFLAKLGPAGNTLLFSTFFGGSASDAAFALAGVNEAIAAGNTSSTDLLQGTVGINALTFGVQIAPAPPFGSFDTPADGSSGLNGAVGVTGWVLCEDHVPMVGIYREPVPGETAPLIYIGQAPAVPGARPDVAVAFPAYPFGTRAGWGLQILTNLLPNSSGSGPIGNGIYKIHAVAFNLQGQAKELGVKTITVDNAHSTLPFGNIDTPAPGAVVSGTLYNFGWALTPLPATIANDGSMITVFVDSIAVGHPVYNQFRADIASLFPGLNNSHGAVGYFIIDTTKLANGIHTIAWSVADSSGRQQGIGSRIFNVQN